MEEKNDGDKFDDVMLPGFRFHPTDEELVGFYLRRKIQDRSLPIELIKEVDIYKYEPWDLPKLATTGEKESYFYCPRDRKYRNSARPNRVTGAGFWKATGTDRPIYSSDTTSCIGLKKSLVFYRGRAAKGMKTDWMMHEFRLPSVSDSTPPKKLLDKNFPPNDSWAICRIFKKTSSMAQRALSHSWVSSLPETTVSGMFIQGAYSTQFSTGCSTETGSGNQFYSNNDLQQTSTTSFFALDIPSYKSMNPTVYKPPASCIVSGDLPNGLLVSPPDMSGGNNKDAADVSSMLFNLSPSLMVDDSKASESIDFEQPFNSFQSSSPQDIQRSIGTGDDDIDMRMWKRVGENDVNSSRGNVGSLGFPFSLPASLPDAWNPNFSWDSGQCPDELSPAYSTTKCYTWLKG